MWSAEFPCQIVDLSPEPSGAGGTCAVVAAGSTDLDSGAFKFSSSRETVLQALLFQLESGFEVSDPVMSALFLFLDELLYPLKGFLVLHLECVQSSVLVEFSLKRSAC